MPSRRPNEPIAPTTIPGQPLDPKIPPEQQADDEDLDVNEDADVGTDERGNEMLSATLLGMPAAASADQKRIPDRSDEPAVQESLDPQRSTLAANSDDIPAEANAEANDEARDDEGNVIEPDATGSEAPRHPRPDSDAGSQ
jgi:hypothetical protein